MTRYVVRFVDRRGNLRTVTDGDGAAPRRFTYDEAVDFAERCNDAGVGSYFVEEEGR